MAIVSLTHLSDAALLQGLKQLVMRENETCLEILVHLAEVDSRRLYLESACSSLYEYCVMHLEMSDDVAWKRIQAARVVREFPLLWRAMQAGAMSMSVVTLLAPQLTHENARELISACARKSCREVRALLATRKEVAARASFAAPHAVPPSSVAPLLAPSPAVPSTQGTSSSCQPATQQVTGANALRMNAPVVSTSPSPTRDVRLDAEAIAMLERLTQLLGQTVPDRAALTVLKHAMQRSIRELERRKFGKCDRPRVSRRESASARTVPAEVRRQVVVRDGERCSYTSPSGRRCEARKNLDFDHIRPVAEGGTSTAENLRLLCRAHNQHAANKHFGRAFMDAKRTAGRAARGDEAVARPTSASAP